MEINRSAFYAVRILTYATLYRPNLTQNCAVHDILLLNMQVSAIRSLRVYRDNILYRHNCKYIACTDAF